MDPHDDPDNELSPELLVEFSEFVWRKKILSDQSARISDVERQRMKAQLFETAKGLHACGAISDEELARLKPS